MMQPHEQRVIDEHAELGDKLEKLSAFFGTELFGGLRSHDQALLLSQHGYMSLYLDTLSGRIERFGMGE